MAQTARTEFAQALKAVATERGLDADVIIETTKRAIEAAFRRDARDRGENLDDHEVVAEINPMNGEARIFAWPLGKPEERRDVTPPGFGRIAAQTAKQVIHQKIREAEKASIMDEFSSRVGSLISGMIIRFDGPNVRVDLGKTEGLMPIEERITTERLSPNERKTFLLKSIEDSARGKQIILSRADPKFVEKLFAREVPEIGSGSVIIKNIAREPGARTKITVASYQSGVDPVGSCVGQKGVRVQAVTTELGGERVDIIPWTEDQKELIKASLAPVEVNSIELNEEAKTATVSVPADQLSLAIGKEGQNVRLASKLTGWKIDVKEAEAKVPVVQQDEEQKLSGKENSKKKSKKSDPS
jgi:N utilization substance protein A